MFIIINGAQLQGELDRTKILLLDCCCYLKLQEGARGGVEHLRWFSTYVKKKKNK